MAKPARYVPPSIYARQYGEQAIDRLVFWMEQNELPEVSLKAICALLDRIEGVVRPIQGSNTNVQFNNYAGGAAPAALTAKVRREDVLAKVSALLSHDPAPTGPEVDGYPVGDAPEEPGGSEDAGSNVVVLRPEMPDGA